MQEHEGRVRRVFKLLLHRLLRGRGSRVRAGRAIDSLAKIEHEATQSQQARARSRTSEQRISTAPRHKQKSGIHRAAGACTPSSAQRQQSSRDSCCCGSLHAACSHGDCSKDWQGGFLLVVGGMPFGGRSPELLHARVLRHPGPMGWWGELSSRTHPGIVPSGSCFSRSFCVFCHFVLWLHLRSFCFGLPSNWIFALVLSRSHGIVA